MNTIKNIFSIIIMISLTGIIACSTTGTKKIIFELLEPDKKIKPAKIAVIAGTEDEIDFQIADSLSKALSKETKFLVLKQEEIKSLIPSYPLNNRIIDFNIMKEKKEVQQSAFLTDSSKSSIDEIQKKLKVDYIFIVWNGGWFVDRNKWTSYIQVNARLIEYPKGDIIAISSFQHDYPLSYESQFKKTDPILLMIIDDIGSSLGKFISNSINNIK